MPSDINVRNNFGYTGTRATERGTKIVKPGDDMDKNAFLNILAAELSNQDPTQNIDSTQYVTQMAQFASMEQMSNLNKTMSQYTSQQLVGKGVTLNVMDLDGNPYTGVVKGVNTTSSGTVISVEINEDGKNIYKDFKIEDVVTVLDVPDYSLPVINNMNGNMSFLVASSFIGKDVELSEKDSAEKNLKGVVKGVFKDEGVVKVRVLLESGEIKEYTYDKIVKVGEFTENKPEDGEK